MLVNDRGDYISSMWTFLQKELGHKSPYIENNLMELVSDRQNNVLDDILDSKL